MKEIFILFLFIAVLDGHLITTGQDTLTPPELLASISLSDENTAIFQPENVTDTNTKLRQLVQKLTTLRAVCEGTAKPILCRNTLKWPMRNLQATYEQLVNSHDAVKASNTLNNKMKLSDEVVKAKEHLARLENNTVLDIAMKEPSDHGH